MTCLVLLLLLAACASAQQDALPCDTELCLLPSCRCSSGDTPGGLTPATIPHFVVLSFDDGVTVSNYPFYTELLNKDNPNNCPISMTFFVSHENSDYTLVNELHRLGNEIAVHSVTHKSDVQGYWRNLTVEQWTNEIVDQKEMLARYGKIPKDEIKGFRAPFLEVGGNNMYEALKGAGFEYDCSWPTLHYAPWFVAADGSSKEALWPYTLDYQSVQDQTIGTKPSASFPGLWVSPMTDLQDNRGIECSMLDACQSEDDELETSSAAVLDLLKRNFKAHMNNRTPFGVYAHHSWFVDNNNRKTGFTRFLDYLRAFPEVYVVSVQQLIEWVKNPKTLEDLGDLAGFQCPNLPASNCPSGNHKDCAYRENLPIDQSEIYMKICEGDCPKNYPYLGNVNGN